MRSNHCEFFLEGFNARNITEVDRVKVMTRRQRDGSQKSSYEVVFESFFRLIDGLGKREIVLLVLGAYSLSIENLVTNGVGDWVLGRQFVEDRGIIRVLQNQK
jgi:hypothetical protein